MFNYNTSHFQQQTTFVVARRLPSCVQIRRLRKAFRIRKRAEWWILNKWSGGMTKDVLRLNTAAFRRQQPPYYSTQSFRNSGMLRHSLPIVIFVNAIEFWCPTVLKSAWIMFFTPADRPCFSTVPIAIGHPRRECTIAYINSGNFAFSGNFACCSIHHLQIFSQNARIVRCAFRAPLGARYSERGREYRKFSQWPGVN